ncbi:uncharacterized protein TNCV_4435701 [Trichonephila clavipes]|nr:uncharacterized protein TNCV_4435701 [Trichonephila clavipes]
MATRVGPTGEIPDPYDTKVTAEAESFKSRRRQGMDVCKCVMHVRHVDTLNSRQAAYTLVRLVKGEEKWEDLDHLQGILPQNWGGAELNHTVTCMVLKATAIDKRISSHLPR